MARRWHCALAVLVACLPRQGMSFLSRPSFPRSTIRPGRSTCTVIAATSDGGDPSEQTAAAAAAAKSAPVPPSLDRSAPPSFIANNNVNLEGDFVSSREGEPTAAELANENLIKIVAQKGADEEVNWILWKCLGYRYDSESDAWKAVSVFPKWEEKYPEPIDLMGVGRVYDPEIDLPIRKAVQTLARSVPSEHKRCIVEQLRPLGFSGLKLDELTPNRTRRAQMTNFLLYYRDHLWGVPLEEVERRRVARLEKAASEAAKTTEAQSPTET